MTEGNEIAALIADRTNPWDWPPTVAKVVWAGLILIFGFLIAFTLGLLKIIKLEFISESTWTFFRGTWDYPVWWIILPAVTLIWLLAALVIFFFGIVIGRQRDRARDLVFKYDNIRHALRESDRLRMIDYITGVPNFQGWQNDLRNWVAENKDGSRFSLILIDLDRLKWLNDRSRTGADLVLRHFARNTHDSMRRNEQIYKVTQEMYRHYQGGDEFFFIMKCDIYDAIGFANRLCKQVAGYNIDIKQNLLPRFLTSTEVSQFNLSFCASASEISFPGDPDSAAKNPDVILQNAFEVLRRAKSDECPSRLLITIKDAYQTPLESYLKVREEIQHVMNLEDSLKSASSENSSTHPDLQHLIARRMRAELHERLLRDAIVAFQKTDDERR